MKAPDLVRHPCRPTPTRMPFLVMAGYLAAALTCRSAALEVPLVEHLEPAANAFVRELPSIEIHFSELVTGVEAADLVINGKAALDVEELGPGQFLFSIPPLEDGPVSAAWRPDHGIAAQADQAHTFPGGSWAYQLDSKTAPAEVQITEFLADNDNSLRDEDGEDSDWIEIHNGSEWDVSLEGWFLTDDRTDLTRWRFPDVVIGAGQFLIVFASEKNRTAATNQLHTNFRLTTSGEYLALISPQTNVISEFAPAYPPQRTDVSYGRVPGASAVLGYFPQPTPGAANSESGAGFAPAVSFSRASGTFAEPFALQLTTDTPAAVLRYTINGNLPTNTSPVYVAPLAITNSVEVRVRAFQDGLLPGPVRSETFLRLSNNVTGFTSDLPVLVIHSLGRGSPNASRYNFAHLSVFEPRQGITSLTNRPALTTRAGIKVRGSSTQGLTKASFSVELWDEFNRDQESPLLGLPADADWVLYAPNNFEPVLIHNPFIHQLSRDMGRYSPRTRFVEVYLNRSTGPVASNHYNGIYVLEEKIKIAPERVAIDKLQPEHVRTPEVTGGYLLKIDRLDPGDSGLSVAGERIAYVDPKEREIRSAQRDPQEQYIRNYFSNFYRVLTGPRWLDPVEGYAAYIDVDAWIDFHVVEVLSGNVDAIVLSTYFHKPRHGKIVFGPHWDFDRALGSTDGRDANPRNWTTGPFFNGWWNRLCRDPDFWQKWIDRYQELRASHFARTNLNALIDRLANEVRQAQPRERLKWRVPLRGGTYQSEVDRMKNWLSNRTDFIDRQLVQPPRLDPATGSVADGFQLTLSGPTNATIYYTSDGSDPRASQGALATQARIYQGPITIAKNSRIVARARNLAQRQTGGPPISSPWSSPVAATFVLTEPPLLLTELMFHPAAPDPGAPYEASDFEFLELKNISGQVLQLPGFHFTEGISFRFASTNKVTQLAPGERVLLVKNLTAFRSRYPADLAVAGEFAGSLDDSGERLALAGPVGELIFDVRYEDEWQPLADGFGFSLTLADETLSPAELQNPAHWTLSRLTGGSPGEAAEPPQVVAPVRVNELLTYPLRGQRDALELFNPAGQPADVSGWFITDDFRSPRKARLPQLALLPPNSYVALEFPQVTDAFSFSRFGEQIYLFSADALGNLTGWHHGFDFGPAEAGVSFGRHVTSTGREVFSAQRAVTLGAANSGPRVGPVLLSEIRFSSGDAADAPLAYIELFNLGADPVPFFDPASPRRTWQMRGSVEIDFPPGLTLGSQQHLLLVSFDPQGDVAARALFTSRFGPDGATAMIGPWRGQLFPGPHLLRLLRPGQPDTSPGADASVPEILVEQVTFDGEATSPALSAASGRALTRLEPAAYADDPGNWVLAEPSPGDSDSDRDGLPDRWEIRHGLNPHAAEGANGPLGDSDSDGFSNLDEFRSGTAPDDPLNYLKLEPTLSNPGAIGLRFQVSPGRSYTIQYRESLIQDDWKLLQTFISAPGRQDAVVIDVPASPQRFYRLITP